LQGDEVVRSDRGGRVVGGAILVGEREGTHPEAKGQSGRNAERVGVRSRDGARRTGQSRAPIGDGLERVERECAGAAAGGRPEGSQPGGAARMPDVAKRGYGGREWRAESG